MLRNKLYKVLRMEGAAETVKSSITFDRTHSVFEGHFPGHPVVPGVCMMQILREILEDHVAHKLRITRGDNLKFLAIINPDETSEVDVDLSWVASDGAYNVSGSIQAGSTTFFKFKGTFQKV